MGTCVQKISDEITSNQMRVNFLAIQFGWARWRHEVVRVVMCCETRGRRGKLPGLWYYFCTETIGRKGVLLRPLRALVLAMLRVEPIPVIFVLNINHHAPPAPHPALSAPGQTLREQHGRT